jgi:uncharacterized damage-inducible protein DinB
VGLFDDTRFHDPTTGDERAMLVGFVRSQRETLVAKCAGLTDALAARAVPPSTLSLIGLVRHLADMERRWFRSVLAGQQAPALFATEANPDADFDYATADPATVAAAWAAWRSEVAFAEEFTAATPLDHTGHDNWRGAVSLRWVLVHMVEEYARHNGHADLLRERIDGAVGL